MSVHQMGIAAILIAGAVGFSSAALAQDTNWATPTAGVFGDPANWVGGVVPDSTHVAVFGAAAGSNLFDVTFTGPAASEGIRVTNQRPVFRLAGHTYTMNGPLVLVGDRDEDRFPILTLNGGTVTSTVFAQIGAGRDNRGELRLEGGALCIVPQLTMSGTGTNTRLIVRESSELRLTGPGFSTDPTATVSINIESGSRMVFNNPSTVSFGRNGATVVMDVSGASRVTLPTNTFLRVGEGQSGVGVLTLRDAGTVMSGAQEFAVGALGASGTVRVENGARLAASRFRIGADSSQNTSAVLTITDPESRVVWTQDFRVGAPDGSTVPSRLEMYDGARLVGTINGPIAFFERFSEFRGTGIIEHAVRFSGSLTISGTPDELTPGTLTILGRYESTPTALVRVPVAGTLPGSQFSQIVVGGNCNPQGTIEMIPVDGFTFTPGQTFEIFRYATGGGNIINVSSPALNRFRANFVQNAVVITVFCPADWTMDNAVNSQDFFAFITAFLGQGPADFNRDGTTNTQDFFDFIAALLAGC